MFQPFYLLPAFDYLSADLDWFPFLIWIDWMMATWQGDSCMMMLWRFTHSEGHWWRLNNFTVFQFFHHGMLWVDQSFCLCIHSSSKNRIRSPRPSTLSLLSYFLCKRSYSNFPLPLLVVTISPLIFLIYITHHPNHSPQLQHQPHLHNSSCWPMTLLLIAAFAGGVLLCCYKKFRSCRWHALQSLIEF